MDPTALLLTPSDVPGGFQLRDSSERELIDDAGREALQASRTYGKRRFLRYGDAIWSEVTIFEDENAARAGWSNLVDFHMAQPMYEDVRELPEPVGDESYLHTGTMRGRPGLWAAVRIGSVVHRFNTYGVEQAPSKDLLQRQLSKHAEAPTPRSPMVEAVRGTSPKATSLVDAIQRSYESLVAAFNDHDLNSINASWHRLQLLAHVGRYADIEARAAEFWDATGPGETGQAKAALTALHSAVSGLARPPESEAAGRRATTPAQLAYVEFLLAQKARDSNGVESWLDRVRNAADLGELVELRRSVDAFRVAVANKNQPEIERAADALYRAVMTLP